MSSAPPGEALAAFGVDETPCRLDGGQGETWGAGDAVLKPLDMTEDELRFQAEVFLDLASAPEFRVAVPRRAADGSLVVAGWTCFDRLAGRHEPQRWPEIIQVGRRFHATLAGILEPEFIGRRSHPWAIGDRVAFGQLAPDRIPPTKHLPRLLERLRPVVGPAQLIHGDLTGNVLFAPGLPPAILDFSPYYRPEPFASAVVVADALVFEGADERLLASVTDVPDFPQFLLRALIYRLVTDRLFRPNDPFRPDDEDPYLPAVELAVSLGA